MGRPPRYFWFVLVTSLFGFSSFTVILARSNGADTGFSGGPDGYNFGPGNCTACHAFDPADNPGPGSVTVLDAPRRYRAGAVYDVRVRIEDPDQAGAGFEISAENLGGQRGEFIVVDPINTQKKVSFTPIEYITHTHTGYKDTVDNWAVNGNAAEYLVRWRAPAVDEGAVTLFVSGNAVNDANATNGDRYYAAYETLPYAEDGDGDGDTDSDLFDFALVQLCFGDMSPFAVASCREVDFDSDNEVSLLDVEALTDALAVGGPYAVNPAGYVLADVVRGGQLYDRWWAVNGAAVPVGTHPLYPPAGTQSGATTFRCKECHGWDYEGVSGAYGSGSHFTGIPGVLGTTLSPQAIFNLLKADAAETPSGHNMDFYGMTDGDIWDVVKFTLEGTIDTTTYIDPLSADIFISTHNPFLGNYWYDIVCASCHDDPNAFDPKTNLPIKGTWYNFGTALDPSYIGTVANDNPWEFFHKMRFGHPASPMPRLELLGWTADQAAVIGMFSVTLPTE